MSKSGNPFDLHNDDAYQAWREQKLQNIPSGIESLIVQIDDLEAPRKSEIAALAERIQRCNMAIYAGPPCADKTVIRSLNRLFGLERLDHNMGADDEGITELEVKHDEMHRRYIPYSNRAIHWHTDGYYNPSEQTIRGLALHCVEPAAEGGENSLMDHELAYIHLRDLSPDYIHAMMQHDAMTIPANIIDGEQLRPAISVAVFSIDSGGHLHMNFTERARNIEWKADTLVAGAVKALKALLHSDSAYIYRGTLQSGQGLISNNVLHDRSGFNNDNTHSRLLYRLRYYDRIKLEDLL